MIDNVVRFPDADRRSRKPDAVPRDPAECDVIILPVIRRLNAPAPLPRNHPLIILALSENAP